MVRRMLSKKNLNLLEQLCLIPTAPRYEEEVQKFLIENYKTLGASETKNLSTNKIGYGKDALNNLYLKLPGNPNLPSIAYLAHADSPAFAINYCREDGFLIAKPIGWINPIDRRLIAGSQALVKGKDKYYDGVFTTKSVHLMEEGEEEETELAEDIFLDVGANKNSELKKYGLVKGMPVFFKPNFKKLLGNLVTGTNLDNRCGTFSLIELSKIFNKKTENRGNVYLISTTSEEVVSPSGSKLVGNIIKNLANIAIALDTTYAVDYFSDNEEATYAKYGTNVKLGDGFVYCKGGLYKELGEIIDKSAKKDKIKYQIEVGMLGADDESTIEYGLLSAFLGVPTRNLHSTVEVINTKDLQSMINIAENIVFETAKNDKIKKVLDSVIRPR